MAKYIQTRNTLVNAAIGFATDRHGGQVRKGNEHIPYIFHPIDVANEVVYHSGLRDLEMEHAKVLAILHDVVEDTDTTIEEIEVLFGVQIRNGVAALSKDESLSAGDKISKMDSLVENISRIRLEENWVGCVKLADRVSNLKSFPAMWSREKIEQYMIESEYIADELRHASTGLYARLVSRIAEARNTLSILKEV